MADLTEQEIKQAIFDSNSAVLTTYTAGRGQQYLQVILADEQAKQRINEIKAQVEADKKLIENVDDLTGAVEENKNALEDNKGALKDNTNANKETAKSLKEHGISWSAVIKKSVDTLAKASGYVYERALREVELTQKISEANVMYSKSAKELDEYANAMNMTLDEYTQFMKENATEFNSFQRVFKDAVIGQDIQFAKIAGTTGATQNEMNKALASYTKMVTRNGEINSMTIDQFNDGATEYIKETKLLAKALGTSTDAVIKQTEQAEKQWQLQLIMNDPSKREAAQALLAQGYSTEQIQYVMTGVINETVAAQMAVNGQTRMELQNLRHDQEQGRLQTQKEVLESQDRLFKDAEFQRQMNNQKQLSLSSSYQTTAGYAGQEYNQMMDTAGSVQRQQNYANISEQLSKLDENGEEKDNQLNKASESIVNFNSKIVENQNRIETLLMPGEHLSSTLDNMASTMDLVNQGIGKLEGILSANWAQTILQGLTLAGMLFTSFGPFINGSLRAFNWLPKLKELSGIGKSLSSLGGNLAKSISGILTKDIGGLLGKAGMIGSAAYGVYKFGEDIAEIASSDKEGYIAAQDLLDKKKKEGFTKDNWYNPYTWGQQAVLKTGADEWLFGKIGEKVGDAMSSVSKWWNDDKNDMRNWTPEQIEAKRQELMKQGLLKDESTKVMQPEIQENKPANIADSQVQNKADIQAEARIKADAEQEVIKSKEEQQQQQKPEEIHIDNVVRDDKTKTVKLLTEDDMQTKLSQMVSLMTEMTNQLALMSSQIPMNNYSQVS